MVHKTEDLAITEWHEINEALKCAAEVSTHVLLYGVPGTGKTTAAYKLSQQLKQEYTAITMHGDLSAQELIGHFVPVGNQTWEFRMGPLAKAFSGDHICSLNEVDQAAGPVNTALYAVLDDPEVARLTTPTGTIRRGPKFLAVGTTNTAVNNLSLPEALLDRFPIRIAVNYPHPNAVALLQNKRIQLMTWDVYTMSHPLRGQVTYRQMRALDLLMSAGMSIFNATRAIFSNDATAREIGATLAL